MINTDWLQLVNLVVTPIIGAVIVWLFKLDQRVFELHSVVLTRVEFLEEMRALRSEISELRKYVKNS